VEHLLSGQIEKNLHIILKTKDDFRSSLAIYRLYRYCGLSPNLIADLLFLLNWCRVVSTLPEVARQYIKDTIGDVFKWLCLSDSQYIFRDILTPSK
jgi:hypothetical protein